MTLLHVADLHFCREHSAECLSSLAKIQQYVENNDVTGVLIAGDSFDAAVINSENSGLHLFVSAIARITEKVPVFVIYGTPTHDIDGSLEILKSVGVHIINGVSSFFIRDKKLIVAGIPEPRRKNLMALLPEGTGKDDVDAAMRQALSLYTLQIAGKVRELKDTYKCPAVLMYHGEISGTRFRKNADVISRGVGIALTTEQLMSIGADYIACGHLHEPQQVFDYPIYYSGSAYPKDFGETHDAGFNVVKIGEKLEVTRESFNHIKNVKLSTLEWKSEQVKGKRVWVELKDQDVDTVTETERLLNSGAVQGSKVTVENTAVETVRVAEITNKKTLEEKLDVYADASGETVSNDVKNKLAELEEELHRNVSEVSGEWELVRVKLRGAIGIRKGIGKKEISIDFDQFENGLIALSGKNGKGKTTLIENCHPYPQLLTREGILKEHFELRDSVRELVYRNGENQYLKFEIQIDGETKSGATKYYAHSGDGQTWTPINEIDGTLKPYADFVNTTFGDISLFLRTAFIAQKQVKNVPDLSVATKGEKKALFAELAGISYLQDFADLAKSKYDEAEKKAELSQARLEVLKSYEEEKIRVNERIQENTVRKDTIDLSILEQQRKIAALELSKLEDVKKANEDIQTNISTLKAQQIDTENRKAGYFVKIQAFEGALQREADAKQRVADYERYQAIVSAETEKQNAINKRNNEKLIAYSAESQKYQNEVRAVEREIAELQSDLQKALAERKMFAQQLEFLEQQSGQPINDICPKCGQKLPDAEREKLLTEQSKLREKIAEYQKKIVENQRQETVINESIAAEQKKLDVLIWDEPIKPEPEQFETASLETAKQSMQKVNIVEMRHIVQQAASAQVTITELTGVIAQLEKELSTCSSKLSDQESKLKAFDSLIYMEKQTELRNIEARYEEQKTLVIQLESSIASDKQRISEIDVKLEEKVVMEQKVLKNKADMTDWFYLQRAFGKDGIQALELDALSPSISDVANRILKSAYGERFKVFFDTTRIGGTGKKTKQIEDFIISVFDNSDGAKTVLENLSGGEAVWIKRAIFDAFSVIRRQNAGFLFKTAFQDEADGALDIEARTAYVRMLEAAHSENKLRHTIFISHSQEVLAMISQKIEMINL